MTARVLERRCASLLVCDQCGGQEVLVHSGEARCFSPGDWVCIRYSGAMTRSIPPQISAFSITCLSR